MIDNEITGVQCRNIICRLVHRQAAYGTVYEQCRKEAVVRESGSGHAKRYYYSENKVRKIIKDYLQAAKAEGKK